MFCAAVEIIAVSNFFPRFPLLDILITVMFFLCVPGLIAVLFFRIRQVENRRDTIQIEQKKVFEFLHELGAAFSEGVHSSALHRLMIESAVHILRAQGGAIYLFDKTDSELIPSFTTDACPPLIPIPEHLLGDPEAVRAYARMTAVPSNEGIFGDVLAARRTCIFDSATLREKGLAENLSCRADSVMAAPLIYRRKMLGVLVLANGSRHTPFTATDTAIFQPIVEQSAFAVFTDLIYIEAAQSQLLVHDLSIARDIQNSLLPKMPPLFDGYEIRAVNEPARHVSGDYYDYLAVDEQHVGIVVADVSGKGIPAAIVMAICRSVLRNEAQGNSSAADVLRRINLQLYPDMREDMFISMVYCIFEKGTGRMTMALAGHKAPFLFRAATGTIEKLSSRGMAVGIDGGDIFNRQITDLEVCLEPGDCLLLYTDGATEALNFSSDEFGTDRLASALISAASHGAQCVVSRLSADIHAFVGETQKYDDITLLAIQRR